jgi:hypothetical protein
MNKGAYIKKQKKNKTKGDGAIDSQVKSNPRNNLIYGQHRQLIFHDQWCSSIL